MNEKTDCCKMNTASQRHFRSSIINNIFAYLGELQGRDKLNADQARKNIFFSFYIIMMQQLVDIKKMKEIFFLCICSWKVAHHDIYT